MIVLNLHASEQHQGLCRSPRPAGITRSNSASDQLSSICVPSIGSCFLPKWEYLQKPGPKSGRLSANKTTRTMRIIADCFDGNQVYEERRSKARLGSRRNVWTFSRLGYRRWPG